MAVVRVLVVRPTLMVSPTFAPTWKAALPNVPSRIFWPFNDVVCAIRSTSARRCELLVERGAVRRRVRRVRGLHCEFADTLEVGRDFASAPSAVCDSEMPSFALRQLVRPLIWVVNPSAIARPAASSFALLSEGPTRGVQQTASELCELFRLRCAVSAATLVVMT